MMTHSRRRCRGLFSRLPPPPTSPSTTGRRHTNWPEPRSQISTHICNDLSSTKGAQIAKPRPGREKSHRHAFGWNKLRLLYCGGDLYVSWGFCDCCRMRSCWCALSSSSMLWIDSGIKTWGPRLYSGNSWGAWGRFPAPVDQGKVDSRGTSMDTGLPETCGGVEAGIWEDTLPETTGAGGTVDVAGAGHGSLLLHRTSLSGST